MSQDSVLAWYNPAPFPFLRRWVPEPEGTAADLPMLWLCHVSVATLAPGGARLQLDPGPDQCQPGCIPGLAWIGN